MDQIFQKYIPAAALTSCLELTESLQVRIKIVKLRVSRHGDYKRLANGQHIITLNATANQYRFLITFVHEIAHLRAFEQYGRTIRPHGKEWKQVFKYLMLPFLRPDVFPSDLLPLLASHFKNPKASSSTDADLALALRRYDPPKDTIPVLEIPQGSIFEMYNGKKFKKGGTRVKRIECMELSTGRLYLFQPNAEVLLIKNK